MSSPPSMASDRPRGDLWDLPQIHVLHATQPVVGAIRRGRAWALPLGGTWAPLQIEPTADALDLWGRSPSVELAAPWDTEPAWVHRAPTCVRWVERGPALARRIAWTDGDVVVRTLPKRVDARAIRLNPDRAQHPGAGEWLASPTPEGANLVPLHGGPARKLPLRDIDEALARDMGGHPAHASALHHLGLRWDGEEIYLDCLRDGTRGIIGAPDLTLEAANGVVLHSSREQADRVFWRNADPVIWVLPHPALARVPHPVRHLPASARPRVRMEAWGLDPEGVYLGLWRTLGTHSQIELWSVRAHDRLKAWPFHPGPGGARVILRRPEPGHLPILWALQAVGPDVVVAQVEFGDLRICEPRTITGAAGALAKLEPGGTGTWSDGVQEHSEEARA